MNLKKLFGIIFGLISLLVIVACGPQQVTVTFNTNGGTAVETLTIEQGTIITEPVTTKTGYTFGGWYENQDFTGSSFDFSKEIVRHITLYAKWTINSYTINFFPDNGQTIPSITKNYNEDIVLPTVTKEGHVFGGWYQNPNFTGEAFTATKMPAANTNLYAKWTPIEITITFYINDEIYATRKVNYGSDLIDIPTPPEVVGKVRYWDVDDFTNITEPMDVNLIEENAVYTVTIVDGEEVIETLHVIHGQTFEPTVTPSKVGYNFVGYFPALGTIITEDTVVTIVYQQITFQVTFYNENGGVIGTPQFVPYGGSATAPNYIPADGYEFIAWDKAFNNITQNTSVTAIVQPKQYSITLHGNGGTFVNNQETHVITADYQSTIGVPPTPTRPGYNFSGWYSNPEGTGNATNFGPGATMPLNGLELYARWTLRNFIITYVNTFGLIHANPSSYTVETNPIILSNQIANRPGYTFVGWFDALNGGNQVTTIDTSILSNQTVYGRWVPNTYTITYNGLNGATNEGNPTTYTIESDSIELSAPGSRTGYTFDGWYADSSYTTPITGIVSGSTGSRTFWAKWVAKTYTVTYNTSGGI